MNWCGWPENPMNAALILVLISVSVGLIMGTGLYFWRKRRPVEYTDIDPPGKA